MNQERLSFLALHFIPGIGDYLVKQLISYCGSAEAVFKKPKGKLLKIPGIGEVTAQSILTQKTFTLAEKEFHKAEKEKTEIVFFTDPHYPARLKLIEDAPSLLYIKGNNNLNDARAVAIVGTRQATDYGKKLVEKIVEELVPHQAVIISGLAYGIDIHAHKQALKHGLVTAGVMGSGMDVIYPAAHKETTRKMIDCNGTLITENHFGTKPDAHNFPARNRIIAGMCDALIVVEAAEKGGALITAEIANSYNKDVFAIPGALGSTFSEGCNKLIKTNRANLYTSVKDLEYIMNWSAQHQGEKQKSNAISLEGLDSDETAIAQLLSAKKMPMSIDQISHQSGMPQGKLASVLLSLEFRNLIRSLPGKQFQIVG